MAKEDMFDELKKQIHQSKFNVDDIIDETLKDTSSFKHIKDTSLMAIVNNNSKNSNSKDIDRLISSAEKEVDSIESTRMNIYRDYEDIMKKVPVIANSVNILIDNIVTPDNNIENIIKYKHSFTSKNSARVKEIISNYELIRNSINLDEKVDMLAENLVVYGDFFVEIKENDSVFKKHKILLDSINIVSDKADTSKILSISKSFNVTNNNENGDPEAIEIEERIITEANMNKFATLVESDENKHIDEISPLIETENIDKKVNNNAILSNISSLLESEGLDKSIKGKALLNKIKVLIEKDDKANSEEDKNKLYNLSKLHITVHHPKNVMAVHSQGIIIGYLVIHATPGDITPNESLAKSILDKLFKNNSEGIKKIIDRNGEYTNYIAALLRSYDDGIQDIQARFVNVDMMIHKANSKSINTTSVNSSSFPYGVSGLEHIRELAKYSIVGNRATMLYRFTRAPDIRIFKVDIGADRDAAKYIQNVKNNITKRKYSLDNSLDVDSLSKAMTQFDDLWVPTKQGQEFFNIDVTPAGDLQSKIDDLKFINDQIVSGLGTPPIYLGLDRAEDSRYTLTQQNAAFAKTISRKQRIVSAGIDQLMKYMYRMSFGSDAIAQSVKIGLNPPTALMLERESEIYSNVSTIMQSLDSLKIPKEYFKRNLMTWMNFDEINDESIEEKISDIEDKVSDSGEDAGGGDEGNDFF